MAEVQGCEVSLAQQWVGQQLPKDIAGFRYKGSMDILNHLVDFHVIF
jgi:hypothetical protein